MPQSDRTAMQSSIKPPLTPSPSDSFPLSLLLNTHTTPPFLLPQKSLFGHNAKRNIHLGAGGGIIGAAAAAAAGIRPASGPVPAAMLQGGSMAAQGGPTLAVGLPRISAAAAVAASASGAGASRGSLAAPALEAGSRPLAIGPPPGRTAAGGSEVSGVGHAEGGLCLFVGVV